MTEQGGVERTPRLYLHEDGKVLSLGFTDTQDTLLSLEFGAARYTEEDRDRGDMKRLREWVDAVSDHLERVEELERDRDEQLAEARDAHEATGALVRRNVERYEKHKARADIAYFWLAKLEEEGGDSPNVRSGAPKLRAAFDSPPQLEGALGRLRDALYLGSKEAEGG